MSYILYLRKSREEIDREHRTGEDVLQTHRERLTALARDRGYSIKEFAEVVSGDTIAGRPIFSHVLDVEIPSGQYKGILVNEISRLGRGDMEDAGRIYKTIIRYDLLIITPHKTYNPQNRSDLRQIRFELFLSREEFELIKERLQDGRDHKAKQGFAPGYLATLGLETNRGKITVVPEEAALVKEVFELRAKGKGYGEIASLLNERGLKTKRGTQYHSSTIRRIIHNKRYIGKAMWRGKEYESQSPALVPMELWNQVHNTVNPSRTVARRTTPEDSPYWVDLYCHHCGNKMHGEWVTISRLLKSGCRPTYNEYGIYICHGRKKPEKCRHQQRINFIHERVLGELKDTLNDKAHVKTLEAEREKAYGRQGLEIKQRIEIFKKQLTEKEKFLNRLENDYAKGELPAVLYGKHYEETNRQMEAIQQNVAELKGKLKGTVKTQDAKSVVKKAKTAISRWDRLATPEKKRIISAFFPVIKVDKSGNLYIMRVMPVSLD